MSLYADYLLERTSDQIVESDYGFATYRYIGDKTVYIVDIYVIPAARQERHASLMANVIASEAKDRGCIEMIGTVNPSAKGATTSLRVLLGYGMELKSSTDNVIVMRKDI